MKKLFFLICCGWIAAAGTLGAAELKLTAQGVAVDAGEFKATLNWPVYNYGSIVPLRCKAAVAEDGLSATLRYGENQTIECRLQGGTLVMKYSPELLKLKKPAMEMFLPEELIGNAGSWEFINPDPSADGTAKSRFPQEKAEKWFSFAGIASACRIQFKSGAESALTLSGRALFYMKDGRLYRFPSFILVYFPNINAGESKLSLSADSKKAAAVPETVPEQKNAPLSFSDAGLKINFGAFQTTLSYPIYKYGTGWQNHVTPKAAVAPDGRSSHLSYGEGLTIDCSIEGDTLVMKYSPAILKWENPATETRIMQDFVDNGGLWEFQNPYPGALGTAKSEFLREKAEKWYSFAGGATGCKVSVAKGKGDSMTLLAPAKYYMRDDRRYHKFWFTVVWFPRIVNGESKMKIKLEKGSESACVLDRFGQFVKVDFPEKIRSEAELAADRAADKTYYASFPKLDRTHWGGLAGSKEKYGLSATGFFHLEKSDALGGRTVLVDPEGNLYFHIGMSGLSPGNEFTCVTGRENIYEELPPKTGKFAPAWWSNGQAVSFYLVNYIRKFGSYDLASFQKQMVERCRAWGFNSFGTFMWIAPGNDQLGFGYTHCIERYSRRKPFRMICEEFFDPYDEENRKLLAEDYAEQTRPYRNNPVLIGYFTENECAYTDVIPALLAKNEAMPAKQVMAEFLRSRYRDDTGAFNAAWKTKFASFDEIGSRALPAPSTARAEADIAAFEEKFFDDYFKLMSSALKTADPDHLYLGERLLVAQTYQEAPVKALAKYCDIFSINYYTDEFDPAEIERFARITGKPLLLSEWSFGSPSQGLFGCRNKANDEERGKAYSRYVENAAASEHVIGIQWMNLLDESNTGRGFSTTSGERFNMGFLNVCDRPFKQLAAHAAESNGKVYDLLLGKTQPVPAAAVTKAVPESKILGIGKVRPGSRVDGSRTKYPGRPGEVISRSVAGRNPQSGDRADMICGWDEKYLYILLTIADDTPASNTHTQAITSGDCVEIFVGADPEAKGRMKVNDRQLGIRCNTSPAPEFRWDCNGGKIETKGKPQIRITVAPNRRSYAVEVAFPWEAIGVVPQVGMKFKFDVAINLSAGENNVQSNKLLWNGLEENYFRRDLWGNAVLEE